MTNIEKEILFDRYLKYYVNHFVKIENRKYFDLGANERYYEDDRLEIKRKANNIRSIDTLTKTFNNYRIFLERKWRECSHNYQTPYVVENFSEYEPIMGYAIGRYKDADIQLGFKWYGMFLLALEKGLEFEDLNN